MPVRRPSAAPSSHAPGKPALTRMPDARLRSRRAASTAWRNRPSRAGQRAGDVQPVECANNSMRRSPAELPDAPRAPRAVSLRQLDEVGVGFLHQQRGARRRAAAADTRPSTSTTRIAACANSHAVGHAGHPAADDRDVPEASRSGEGSSAISARGRARLEGRDEAVACWRNHWRHVCFGSTGARIDSVRRRPDTTYRKENEATDRHRPLLDGFRVAAGAFPSSNAMSSRRRGRRRRHHRADGGLPADARRPNRRGARARNAARRETPGYTSAHLTMVTDAWLQRARRPFGRDHAQAVWDAGLAAIAQIDAIVARRGHRRATSSGCPAICTRRSATRRSRRDVAEAFREEAALAAELGFDAAFVDEVPFVGGPGVRVRRIRRGFTRGKYLAGVARAIDGARRAHLRAQRGRGVLATRRCRSRRTATRSPAATSCWRRTTR